MKNFALLLSSLAVASSAFAAAPEVNRQLEKSAKSSAQPVQMTAGTAVKGQMIPGKSRTNTSRKVLSPKKAEALTLGYQEPAGIFALGLSEELRGYDGFSYRKGPAYAPLTWLNTSTGADEFEWEVIKDFSTGETQLFKTVDFEHSETYSIVDAPVLYGMDAAGASAVFQFGTPNVSTDELSDMIHVQYFFGGGCKPDQTQFGMSTYMHGYNTVLNSKGEEEGCGFTRFSSMGYNVVDKTGAYDKSTGLLPVYSDKEDGYGFDNPIFEGYANIFEKPASPYLISKMWCWLYGKANKATTIEMTLFKIDDEGYITDEILASGEASVEKSASAKSSVITFELFSLDEDGLQTEDPIVIDCAYAAVMTVNKDDFDELNSICGAGAMAPTDIRPDFPVHACILINTGEELRFLDSPYRYYADDDASFIYVTDFMWMVDAVFPWTYAVDDETEVIAPAEGGTVSFNISSYYGIQYFGYSIPDDCDWIDLENGSIEDNEELSCQTLNLPVAALPEGVEGRSAVVEVEGIGSSLTLTVKQGEGNAVSFVVADKGAQYFDLQGRRVANPEKGIFIKKSGNKAEKVIL